MAKWNRIFVIIPVENIDAANAMAAQLDFDSGGGATFSGSQGLSRDGLEPASHVGASSLVGPGALEKIEEIFLPELPAARFYQESEGWSWRRSLRAAGLRPITSWE